MRSHKSGMKVYLVAVEDIPCLEPYSDVCISFLMHSRNCIGHTGAEIDYRAIQAVIANRIGRSCAENGKRSFS